MCNEYLSSFSFTDLFCLQIIALQYFLAYGPDYQLGIPPGRRHDMNTKEDLVNLLNIISGTHEWILTQLIPPWTCTMISTCSTAKLGRFGELQCIVFLFCLFVFFSSHSQLKDKCMLLLLLLLDFCSITIIFASFALFSAQYNQLAAKSQITNLTMLCVCHFHLIKLVIAGNLKKIT